MIRKRNGKKIFSVNSSNNLVIKNFGQKKPLPIKGKFKIEGNRLIYSVNESKNWRRQNNVPGKIAFEGKWSLNSNHDLVLNVAEDRRISKSTLVLKGKIENVDKGYLRFQVKSKINEQINKFYLLKLRGVWKADRLNRIVFEITKKSKTNILTFQNSWKINKNQEVSYTYKKYNSLTKTKTTNFITFCGFWQINQKNRLKYIIEKSSRSFFEFRAQIESPNIYPKKGEIRYRLGIGLEAQRNKKPISLYGRWNFNRKLGLFFEIGRKKTQRIKFGAAINLSKKNKIFFNLLSNNDRPLGFSLVLMRNEFLGKDLDIFMKLKSQGKLIYIGGNFKFCF